LKKIRSIFVARLLAAEGTKFGGEAARHRSEAAKYKTLRGKVNRFFEKPQN